jgi:hypothetical protein
VAVYDGRSVAAGGATRLVNDFFAFDSTTRTGVFVAAGDVNGDGFADLVFGPEDGGAPRVTVFGGQALMTGSAAPEASYFAAPSGERGGIRVAVHDLDGDGRAEVITGGGVGTGSRVRVYDGASVFSAPRATEDFDWVPGLLTGVFVG